MSLMAQLGPGDVCFRAVLDQHLVVALAHHPDHRLGARLTAAPPAALAG